MGSSTTPTSTLPAPVQQALSRAYTEYSSTATSRYAEGRAAAGAAVAQLVEAARARRWPLRLLAQPCGVSEERLRQIVKQYGGAAESSWNAEAATLSIPEYARPPRATRDPSAAAKNRPHLQEEQAARLRELAPLAKRHGGAQADDSPYRRASEELSALIHLHHNSGVIWAELSDATRGWTQWPIPAETLTEIRRAEAAGEPSPLPPELTVSGLRMRAARHR